MIRATKGLSSLAGAALLAAAACGGPGLPPAGPAPGNVDVGYGSQPQGKVTGAVTTISDSAVSQVRPFTLEELLRGRVAGLQVIHQTDGSVSFRIRSGPNSMLLDQDPLFIVDGIPIATGNLQSALAGRTPDDIRQVDVLKDVASTSIYGSRGAGGVILITTRR